jgi:FkbM family methyltransferase
MKNIFIKPGSPLRKLFPAVRTLRYWAWKFHDRTGIRLVISGGKVQFLDAELNFPENVGLTYATPLFWNGPDAYEGPTSRAIARLVRRARLFLDIGSNIGIYAVYAGVKCPHAKTFAFEPVPVIWEKNRAFHRANQLSETDVLNLAMGDREGMQKMFIPIFNTGIEEEQTATLNADSWQTREKKVETFEVRCITLDMFAAANQLPAGAVALKIDVENFEAAVLRGGKTFISDRRPWIVCEILANQETDSVTGLKRNKNEEVLALVAELGYAPFAITSDGFFRMTATDFARPRQMKDFLLTPAEKIPPDTDYFALENLDDFLTE